MTAILHRPRYWQGGVGPTPPPEEATIANTSNINPARMPFSLTLPADAFVIESEYRVTFNNVTTRLLSNQGDILDLADWRGDSVAVQWHGTIAEPNATAREIISNIVVITPNTFAKTVTVKSDGSGDFDNWKECLDWLHTTGQADTCIQLHPHGGGEWLLDSASGEASRFVGHSKVLIEGIGSPRPVLNGMSANAGTWAAGLRVGDGATDVAIRNIDFRDFQFGAVLFYQGSQKASIRNCLVRESKGRGMALDTTGSEFEIINNTIQDNLKNTGAAGGDPGARGIIGLKQTGTAVRLNTIQRLGLGELERDGQHGIHFVGQNNSNTVIDRNTIDQANHQGILVINGPSNTTVTNNTMTNCWSTGVQIENSDGRETIGGLVRGNRIIDCNHMRGEGGVWLDGCRDYVVEYNYTSGGNVGYFSGEESYDNVWRHNIAVDCTGNTPDTHSMVMYCHQRQSGNRHYNMTGARCGNATADQTAASINGSGIFTTFSDPTDEFALRNCIILDCVGNTLPGKQHWQIMQQQGVSRITSWDYNIYWNEPNAPNSYATFATQAINFGDYQTQSGLDANTSNADPNLDPVTLVPNPGSIAIDTGRPPTDFVGAGSGTTHDVVDGKWFKVGDYVEVNDTFTRITNIAGNTLTFAASVTVAANDGLWHHDRQYGTNKNRGAL